MSSTAFDINTQRFPYDRAQEYDLRNQIARQATARADIVSYESAALPRIARLHVSKAPDGRRELLGFSPVHGDSPYFLIESHVSLPLPEDEESQCDPKLCGAALYDAGVIKLNGMHERPEVADLDASYEWIRETLGRIATSPRSENPHFGAEALNGLMVMHERGHAFLEEHTQREMSFALGTVVELGR